MKKNYYLKFPMRLQFFADGGDGAGAGAGDGAGTGTGDGTGAGSGDGSGAGGGQPSYEELMIQLAEERTEKAKMKASFDKASSEAANYKKQLQARMTAEEKEAEAKKAAEEAKDNRIKAMESELAVIKATDRYRSLGMDEELAKETAQAEIDGDMDKVAANFGKHNEATRNAAYQKALGERPDVNAGNGGNEKDALMKDLAKAAAARQKKPNNDILKNYQ